MPPRLPEKVRRRVVPEFRKMGNAAAVAARLDIGHTTVLRVLAEAGIPRATPTQAHPHRFSPEGEREVVRRYVAGERSGVIAREMECSVFLIRKLAKKAGCIILGRGNRVRDFTPDQLSEMKAMWAAGESQKAIGRRFGAAQPTISMALRREGVEAVSRRPSGSRHGNWSGGRITTGDGYVIVMLEKNDPLAEMRSRGGYVREHRLVMARSLGRVLARNETVHHINGKRDDNRIENLELWHSRHPRGERVAEQHCATCTCGHGTRTE